MGDGMSNNLFLDDLPALSNEATEAVKQIADHICNNLYQKLDAIDASVSDEEIESFARDLAKVAEDNKDKINYIPALEE
jgi:division protein CdvB (Snf7/Vps24/ESCRT-III family)